MSDSYKPRSLAEIMNDVIIMMRNMHTILRKNRETSRPFTSGALKILSGSGIVSSCFLRNSSQSG